MKELKVFVLSVLCAVGMTLFIGLMAQVIFDYTLSRAVTFGMSMGLGVYYSMLFRRNLK